MTRNYFAASAALFCLSAISSTITKDALYIEKSRAIEKREIEVGVEER